MGQYLQRYPAFASAAWEEHSEVVCPRVAGRGGSVKPLPPPPQRAQDAVTARGSLAFFFGAFLGRLACPAQSPLDPESPLFTAN